MGNARHFDIECVAQYPQNTRERVQYSVQRMRMDRQGDIDNFYGILRKLALKTGTRCLGQCNGRMKWPKQGVYFFFEEGEFRKGSTDLRVVRVGTHAVSKGAKTTLWKRLRNHRGPLRGKYPGGGDHRGSVFRLHVGTAIINREKLNCSTWNIDSSAPTKVKVAEHPIEVRVSKKIGSMPFLWLKAIDAASKHSIRKVIEKNSIALLSNYDKSVIDPPSVDWLGRCCEHVSVRESGLWNVDHTDEDYDPGFLGLIDDLVVRM